MQVTLRTLHEHIGSSPLLQTMQVTLLTLHEHIGSSPLITDYASNTTYSSRTHWFIPIITDYASNIAVQESTFQKHRQHLVQDTERKQIKQKHNKKNKMMSNTDHA
jgi:hypothetical protein